MAIRDGFNCYGHFYNLFLENKKIAECRSVLEIIKINSNISRNKVAELTPNAVVIMMNPGKSYPLGDEPERIDLEIFNESFISKHLLDAFPDDTQIRIMKLMRHKNWNHVRVINLSDIREGDSDNLFKLINRFELITSAEIHSIFSSERQSERNLALSNDTVPILIAWGVKEFLEVTAKKCLGIVSTRLTFGVPSKESENLFQHPLTRRTSWYLEMVELLKEFK